VEELETKLKSLQPKKGNKAKKNREVDTSSANGPYYVTISSPERDVTVTASGWQRASFEHSR
jgi:hypothetical protein